MIGSSWFSENKGRLDQEIKPASRFPRFPKVTLAFGAFQPSASPDAYPC